MKYFHSLFLIVLLFSCSHSLDWIESSGAPRADWYCSAMSGNGLFAIAGALNGGELYTTEDFGVSWVPVILNQAISVGGTGLSSSSQYSIVTGSNHTGAGRIWYSDNYMNSWNESQITGIVYNSVALSGVGQYGVVVEKSGKIWLSNDFCQSFITSMSPTLDWTAIRMSRTGQIAVALSETHGIYYSHDYGMTWTASDAPALHWSGALAMNEVGDVVVAGRGLAGLIYISRDFGVTWNARSNSAFEAWQTIACDATGQYIIAAGDGTAMHTSTDYGQTWKIHGDRAYHWQGLALNAAATRAIVFRGDISADGTRSDAAIYHAYLPFLDGNDNDDGLPPEDAGGTARTQESIIWFSISGGFFVIFVALVYYYTCVDGAKADTDVTADEASLDSERTEQAISASRWCWSGYCCDRRYATVDRGNVIEGRTRDEVVELCERQDPAADNGLCANPVEGEGVYDGRAVIAVAVEVPAVSACEAKQRPSAPPVEATLIK